MQLILYCLACLLIGMAMGRIAATETMRRACATVRHAVRQHTARPEPCPTVDTIDKRVQCLCPQVWRQRRLADDAPEGKGMPMASRRTGWRMTA